MIFSNTSVLISGKVAEPSFDSAKEPGKSEEKRKDILVNVAVGQLVPKSVCVGGWRKGCWVFLNNDHGFTRCPTICMVDSGVPHPAGARVLVVVCWVLGRMGTMERNKNKVSAYRTAWHQLFAIHWHNHGGQKNRGPRPTLI